MMGTRKPATRLPASRTDVVARVVPVGVEEGGISLVAISISIVGVLLLILGAGPPM
jgi:hypothetical protein